MADLSRVLRVIVEFTTRGAENLRRVGASLTRANRQLTVSLDQARKQADLVGQSWTVIYDKGRRTVYETIRYDTALKRHVRTVREVIRTYDRFRFYLLSVMFFGWGMYGLFDNLIKQVLRMTGVSQLLNIALMLLAYTALEPLLGLFYGLGETLLNLDPNIKLVLGSLMVLLVVLGLFLWWLGALGLGIQGLITLLGTVSGAVAGFAAVLGLPAWVIWAVLIAAIIALIGFLALLWLAWQKNFGRIRDHFKNFVSIFKEAFENIKRIFEGFWDIITGILELNVDKVMGGIDKALGGIWNLLTSTLPKFVREIGSTLWDIAVAVGTWAWKFHTEFLPELLKRIGKKVLDFMTKTLPEIVKRGLKELSKIVERFPIPEPLKGIAEWAGEAGRRIGGLLHFQYGGVVPGPIGAPRLALVHGGETVLPAGVAPINVTVNVYASGTASAHELASEISRTLYSELRRFKMR